MNADDIQQKLSQLPDNLISENIKSWKYVLSKYQRFAEIEYNEWIFPVRDLVQNVADTELAKLFRAGTSLYSLLISTAERHGLKGGEPFVAIEPWRNRNPRIEYWQNDIKVLESLPIDSTDILFEELQPFLDRLWNETREKKNA